MDENDRLEREIDVLRVALEVLQTRKTGSREHSIAKTKCEEAIHWLMAEQQLKVTTER